MGYVPSRMCIRGGVSYCRVERFLHAMLARNGTRQRTAWRAQTQTQTRPAQHGNAKKKTRPCANCAWFRKTCAKLWLFSFCFFDMRVPMRGRSTKLRILSACRTKQDANVLCCAGTSKIWNVPSLANHSEEA